LLVLADAQDVVARPEAHRHDEPCARPCGPVRRERGTCRSSGGFPGT